MKQNLLVVLIFFSWLNLCIAQETVNLLYDTEKSVHIDSIVTLSDSIYSSIKIGQIRYNGKNTVFIDSIAITNSSVDELSTTNFWGGYFLNEGNTYNGYYQMAETTGDYFDYKECTFHNVFLFRNNRIRSAVRKLEISNSDFFQDVIFDSIKVSDSAEIVYSYLKTKFDIRDCDIQNLIIGESGIGYIDIYNSKLNKALFFLNDLDKGINFSNVTIQDSILFFGCEFFGGIYFNNVEFGENATLKLYRSNLPDTVAFIDISNFPTIDLTHSHRDDGRKSILLINTPNFTDIKLNYKDFKLIFEDRDRDYRFSSSNTEQDKVEIYEKLLSIFRKNADNESYMYLDIEYNDFKWKQKGLLISWLRVFPKYWNSYGYDNTRILNWAWLFIFIYTLATFFLINTLLQDVYSFDEIPMQSDYKHNPPKENFKRLWYSFIYTVFVFFMLTIKFDKIKLKRPMLLFYFILIYMTGLFCIYIYGKKLIDTI